MRLIDLSVPFEANVFAEQFRLAVTPVPHEVSACQLAERFGISSKAFPDSMALAWEDISSTFQAGTHMDAPYHFGPYLSGEKSRTIDQIPLEWFYGDGVDVRHVQPAAEITAKNLDEGLKKINYTLKPFDIVLIMTGWDKYIYEPKYLQEQPGMSREATVWLLDRGIKVIGIDTCSFDRPFDVMAKAYKEGKPNALFPAHFVGREREYCHIEKLGNLDKIPIPQGFTVAAFPQSVKGGSAGALRPVAIIDN